MKTYYVYIMASRKNGTLYVGVTFDLIKRVAEHKHGSFDGFTKKYAVHTLVYFASMDDIRDAIEFEKKIKNRGRGWKVALIEKENPGWNDLASFLDPATSRRMTK